MAAENENVIDVDDVVVVDEAVKADSQPEVQELSKDDLINRLLLIPTLTSEWIDTAVDFTEKHHVIVNDLFSFSPTTINMIEDFAAASGMTIEATIDYLKRNNFNDSQLHIILGALKGGLAFDEFIRYINPEMPYAIMNWVLSGINAGFNRFKDVEKYKKYNPNQLAEIYSGLRDGIKVDDYDDAELSYKIMAVIRHARVLGLTAEYNKETRELTIY